MQKPYKYKLPRKQAAWPVNRIEGFTDAEVLSGTVKGWPASDLEERFARGLDKLGDVIQGYAFRVPYIAGRNLPGEIEVDFLVYLPEPLPVMVDGQYSHRSAEQKTKDAENDAILNDHLMGVALPVRRVKDFELQDQEMADATAREVALGG